MGNVHSVAHRLTALSMACLASAGLIFCALGGFSCSFVQVQAQPDRNLMNSEGEIFDAQVGYFGVQCPEDSPFYSENDRLWSLSQLFFYISLGFGGFTTLLAWALTCCIPPTACRWRSLSVFSAITAVMQVPIFLLFESDTCNLDTNRQTCKLAMGAYMNILSVILWAIMTIWIQCLNAPQWAEEINAWKVDGSSSSQDNSQSSSSSKGGPDGPKSFYTTESEDDSYPRQMGNNNRSRNGYTHEMELYEEESDPELAWASMNSAERRAMERNIRASRKSNRDRGTAEEDVEEAAMRDASCMERILAGNGGKQRRSKRRSQEGQNPAVAGCAASLPIDETSKDILQEAAATVMQSLSGESGDAVCRGYAGPDDGVEDDSKSSQVSKSVSSFSAQAKYQQCCPENVNVNCVTQQAAQLPAAVAACILPECEEEAVVHKEFVSIPGMPESYPAGEENGDDEGDDETNKVDYLTKRMRSDMNVLASGDPPKSRVAPLQTIQIDTSYVQDHDASDEVSEMTRGSGVASGVSEVLDTDRRRINDDPMTILDDLMRTY